MKRRESDSFLMLFLKLRGGINVAEFNLQMQQNSD